MNHFRCNDSFIWSVLILDELYWVLVCEIENPWFSKEKIVFSYCLVKNFQIFKIHFIRVKFFNHLLLLKRIKAFIICHILWIFIQKFFTLKLFILFIIIVVIIYVRIFFEGFTKLELCLTFWWNEKINVSQIRIWDVNVALRRLNFFQMFWLCIFKLFTQILHVLIIVR